ncbi:MAG: integrating conjugative element protein [Enterobacteriaceae bacterium]
MNLPLLSSLVRGVLLGVVCVAAQAELTVVDDLGGQSTEGYFEGINNQGVEGSASDLQNESLPPVILARGFPIKTPELTPGKVEPRVLNLPGMSPLFLMGDDDLSRRWLSLRLDTLLQLNAVGMVVNVASEEAFRNLEKQAEGLELVPVSGSDLAKRLGLTHYPLLLTGKGLEQ